MPEDEDICGEPCKTGGACSNPAVNPDGSCWIPSHGPTETDREDPGRPCKLTPELQEAICADLAEGYPITVASETNGISEDTYHRWRKIGRSKKEADEQGPFREFFERTTRARREGERKWTERAFKYAVEADSFGAVMEILRKRYPESWTGYDDDEAEDRLRVLLSNDDSPEDAGSEYAMTPEDADE